MLTLPLLAVLLGFAAAEPPVLDFAAVGVPIGVLQHQVVGSKAVAFNGEAFATGFQSIIRTGTVLPRLVPTTPVAGRKLTHQWRRSQETTIAFGLAVDETGNPIYETSQNGTKTTDMLVSNEPDFVTYLTPEGTPDRMVYQLTHFESPRPASLYITSLKQDAYTCSLTPVATAPVDWSAWHGLWIPCAGVKTTWGTHLGGEEYEPDARALSEAVLPADVNKDIVDYLRYFNLYPADIADAATIQQTFNPYNYGYVFEVAVDGTGQSYPAKHLTMGRLSHELAFVMPDSKTVYLSDDGDMVLWAAFVADEPENFASGTLYAAKFTQIFDVYGGEFTLEWIDLGHATQEELLAVVDTITFADIFEVEDPAQDMTCPTEGFTPINAGSYGIECLQVKEGMEVLASRFETRRYAATLGATTEFSKWEGIAFDVANNKLHIAMSAVRRGMEDNAAEGEASMEYDIPSANAVRLPFNPCGCVYALPVEDKDGWLQTTSMKATLCGERSPPNADGTDPNNVCVVNNLASPDNMITAEDKLIVAEDTSEHVNNMLWALPLDTATAPITRILTAPYGAEITGVGWYPNMHGCAYLFASIQHPYEGYEDQLEFPYSSGIDGWVGFIGPIVLPVEMLEGNNAQDGAEEDNEAENDEAENDETENDEGEDMY